MSFNRWQHEPKGVRYGFSMATGLLGSESVISNLNHGNSREGPRFANKFEKRQLWFMSPLIDFDGFKTWFFTGLSFSAFVFLETPEWEKGYAIS